MNRTIQALTLAALAACSTPYAIGGSPARLDPSLFSGQPTPVSADVVPAAPQAAPTGTPVAVPSAAAAPDPVAGLGQPPVEPPPLVGWNGEVIEDQRYPRHDVTEEGDSRPHLVALYQEVLDDRDRLALEVSDLRALLGQFETKVQNEAALLAGRDARIAELEGVVAAERARNDELSGRLVTAQIRRLETERILLQDRIARSQAMTPGAPGLVVPDRSAATPGTPSPVASLEQEAP